MAGRDDFDQIGDLRPTPSFNPLAGRQSGQGRASGRQSGQDCSSGYQNTATEDWRHDAITTTSQMTGASHCPFMTRIEAFHETLLEELSEVAPLYPPGIVKGSASEELLQTFSYLPEIIQKLMETAVSYQFSSGALPLSALEQMYMEVIVRELQSLMNSTLLDASFSQHFDDHVVEAFLGLWYEVIEIVSFWRRSRPSPDDNEHVEDLKAAFVEVAEQLVEAWAVTEYTPSCTQRVVCTAFALSGADRELLQPEDRARMFVLTGLCISILASVLSLLLIAAASTELSRLLPGCGVLTASMCLAALFCCTKNVVWGRVALFLFALTPLGLHEASSGCLGIVFFPPWFATALGVWDAMPIFCSASVYLISFATRACFLKYDVLKPAEVDWVSDAASGVVIVLIVLTILIGSLIVRPMLHVNAKYEALWYRQVSLACFKQVKSYEAQLADSSDFTGNIMTLLHSLRVVNTKDLDTHDMAKLSSLQTMLCTIVSPKYPSGVLSERGGKMKSDMSLIRLKSSKPQVREARFATCDFPQPLSRKMVDDPLPAGELLFPDTEKNSGGSVIRIDGRNINGQLGILITNLDGEIIHWNENMRELTGIPSSQAIGNEIISYVLDSEQTMLLSRLEVVARRSQEGALWGADADEPVDFMTIPFIRGDGINRAYLDVHVASSFSGKHLALICARPRQQGIDPAVYTRWVLDQVMPSVYQVFEDIAGLNTGDGAVARVASKAEECKKLANNLGNLVHRSTASLRNKEQGFCWLHVRTMLNKMVNDFSKVAARTGLNVRCAPFSADCPNIIYTHPAKLTSAFAYLISNAIRHSSEGGQVVLSLHKILPGDQFGVPTLCISVTDEGCGIRREFLASIFDATMRAADSKKGLPITNGTLHEIGGYLDVVSEIGVGSTFTIKMPYPTDDVEEKERPSKHAVLDDDASEGNKPGEPSRVPIKCLLLESNQTYRTAYCQQLWECGYSLVIRSKDLNSVDLDDFDLIIAGIESTGLDVAQLLEDLKHRTTQVILASKLFTEHHREIISEAGWFGLSLPLRYKALDAILSLVGERVAAEQSKAKEIEDLRKAFEGNASCPWERGKALGVGSFGKVYEATNTLTGGKMACKIIPIDTDNDEQLFEILREVTVMAGLSHPNIIHYFYCERGEDELHIFMELASESLSSKIPPRGMPTSEASQYMRDIVLGLQYLHSKDIVHRDIKVANVLIHKGACKLTDFGTAITMPKRARNAPEDMDEKDALLTAIAGTPHYMAPELLNGKGYDWRADIWSLGCLLMEMVTGKPPWAHVGGSWGAVKYVSALLPQSEVNYGPFNYHESVLDFLMATLAVCEADRLTTAHLLEMPLLTEMNDDMIRKSSVFDVARAPCRTVSLAKKPAKLVRQEDDSSGDAETRSNESAPTRVSKTHSARSKKPKAKKSGVNLRVKAGASSPKHSAPAEDDEDRQPTLSSSKVTSEEGEGRRGTQFSGWGSFSA